MSRNNGRVVKRVTWKVTRGEGDIGWLPVVLIGEVPITYAAEQDKHDAKARARRECNHLRGAGQ